MIGKMSNYFDASGTIGFTCDNCGRELQGCTWVNGMKFCAKCYQETFGNTTSQYVDMLNKEMYELKIATFEQKIADLEAKLAEKEKQLENAQNLKAIEVADELSLKLSKIHNQDKISFAIAELEKVKENIHYLLSFDYNLLCKVNEQFDNQIKQLKEGK